MSKTDPCYKCTRRKVTLDYNCHSHCPDYAKMVADNEKRKQYARKKVGEYESYLSNVINKRRRIRNEKNRH